MMVEQDNECQGGFVIPWKTVSISTIIASIPVMIGVNHAYENWHEDFGNARWAAKAELVLAQNAMASNNAKLDIITAAVEGIQIQTAITVASDFQRQLDTHMSSPRQSADWIAERDRLIRQVKRAEDYKQCLIDQKPNCDQLRGW